MAARKKTNQRTAIPVVVLTGLLVTALPGTAAAQGVSAVHQGFTVRVGQEFTETVGKIFTGFPPDLNPKVSAAWGDGTETLLSVSCFKEVLGLVCSLTGTHAYKASGVYVVRLKYAGHVAQFPIQVIDPPGPRPDPLDEFVLVSVGDSVASGEGAPTLTVTERWERFGEKRPLWDDGLGASPVGVAGEASPRHPDESLCHRSQWAHGWQLLRRLEAENPETRFTMLHRACTGSETDNKHFWLSVSEQISGIDTALMAGQEVDALLMSVGANDRVGDYRENSFGDSISACIAFGARCDLNEKLLDDLNYKFEFTPVSHEGSDDQTLFESHYSTVDTAIDAVRGNYFSPGRPVHRTYITEYYDPTKNDLGQYDGGCSADLFTASEFKFLHDELMAPLNRTIKKVARDRNWVFVDGIAERFVNHGFCAPDDQRFVANFWDSVNDQHTRTGTAHPNRRGHWVIADQIYHTMLGNQPPRTTATAVAGDAAYSYDTWTNKDVTIELRARNLRGAGADQLEWTLYHDGKWIDSEKVQAQETKAPPSNNPNDWLTGKVRPAFARDTMPSNSQITPNVTTPLWSDDGRFRLTYQLDGNLVLYYGDDALWASNTVGSGKDGRLVMQNDGNLVLYDYTFNNPVWWSNTQGNPGAYLKIQDDGNVAIYRPGPLPGAPHTELWSTGTKRRFTTLSDELVLNADGDYKVEFRSANANGVWEEARTVNVRIDRTSPKVTLDVSPPPNGDGWNRTDVWLTLTTEESAGSGLKEFRYAIFDLKGRKIDAGMTEAGDQTTIRVSAKIAQEGIFKLEYWSFDKLGNIGSGGDTIMIDKTAPTIALTSRLPAANEHGWNNTDITVTWSCADDLSGPTAATVSKTISFFFNNNDTLEGTCLDHAGNTASHVQGGLKVDKFPPTISLVSRLPAENASGWNNQDITVRWVCMDGLLFESGLPTGILGLTRTLSTEGTNQSLEVTCEDRAGNTASNTVNGLNLDKTPPRVTFGTQSPPPGPAGWNNSPVAMPFTVSDDLSGLVSTSSDSPLLLDSDGAAVTGTVTATDAAGNTASVVSPAVRIDRTPPAIALVSRLPAANAAGWNRADITATWSCVDAQSGSSVKEISKTLDTEGPDQSLSGTCTDAAGNEAKHTVSGLRIDKTPPAVTFGAPSAAPNVAGWHNTAVSIPFTAIDDLSGVVTTSSPSPLALTSDGVAVTGTVTVTDAAGNSATAQSPAARIDRTPPAIALVSRLPAANAAGWNRTDITATWSCADALSGSIAEGVSKTLATEGHGQSLTGACLDAAGNEAVHTVGGLSLDKTAPSVTFGAPSPAPNAAGWNNTPVSIPFTASDDLSGVASTSSPSPLALTTEGVAVSATVTATDAAGNATTVESPSAQIDLTPPAIACNPTPAMLRPPNNKMVAVGAALNVTDTLSGSAGFTLDAITVNEAAAADDITGFVVGSASTAGELRATRAGGGSGRIYTLKYAGRDAAGNQTACTAQVVVPHDQGK